MLTINALAASDATPLIPIAGAVPVRKRLGTAFADRPKGSAADQPEATN